MSVLWTASEIAAATGGMMSEPFEATGLSIDSRTTQPGDLFVALVGERDGHDYIDAAMKKGAAGVLSSRATDAPDVRVKDTLDALRALGKASRDRCNAIRIAVTGSVGKTSVKDALAVMLTQFGKTHASIRSFNNHIGVPITLATMPRDTEYAVFETGMNHAGELTDLSLQVKPRLAIITNVGGAHQAMFESEEAIADAKAEIAVGLTNGYLFLNSDNRHTPRIRERTGAPVRTFGWGGDIDIVGSEHSAAGGVVRIIADGSIVEVRHNLPGAHWDHNIAACIGIAQWLRLDLGLAASALSNIRASDGRGDTHVVSVADKTVTLIDQSYNANPTSMRAAISAASLLPGRKVALLGDMYELGADELALHASLAEPLESAGFARVITTGECMRALRGALPPAMRAAHADPETIREALADELQDGDVLLIKGSNATGLSKLAAELKRGDG